MATPTMKPTSAVVRYGGFVLSVGAARALGAVITSITFPILVRRLGVEMYGLWSYVVALCAFLRRSWPIRGLALTSFNRLPPAGTAPPTWSRIFLPCAG